MDKPLDSKRMMRELIRLHPMLLMVLRRFNISLGFGNATVGEVCAGSDVDTQTFLAVANFVSGHSWSQCDIDIHSLLEYLRNSHEYFLTFSLPAIRRKLIEAVSVSEADGVGMLLLRYFDDFAEEVALHMEYENRNVFPPVEDLLSGRGSGEFNISTFAKGHNPLAPKLEELKEIFVSHYRGKGNEDLINAVLYDIITCEADLTSHCEMEDNLLVPAVRKIHSRMPAAGAKLPAPEGGTSPGLTGREKEIVRRIARGMSTKEIAEELFVSVHTVTTHRRNICAKLDIHSASALTIYAIIHKLVDISEIAAPR